MIVNSFPGYGFDAALGMIKSLDYQVHKGEKYTRFGRRR
jgi:hypothetical protein